MQGPLANRVDHPTLKTEAMRLVRAGVSICLNPLFRTGNAMAHWSPTTNSSLAYCVESAACGSHMLPEMAA